MRRLGGYSIITDPDSGLLERDTFTCAHCNKITHLKALCSPTEQGGWCRKCDALICADCVGSECYPMEQRLTDWEKIGNKILSGL